MEIFQNKKHRKFFQEVFTTFLDFCLIVIHIFLEFIVLVFFIHLNQCNTLLGSTLKSFVGIGPLQDPVTWYGINYAVGLSKQRKVGLDWYEFLCFGSPTASFASQCNLFRTM